MALIWAEFEERPELASYRRLHEHAQAGDADWATWSDRAIALLRRDVEKPSAGGRRQQHRWEPAGDRSRLVEIERLVGENNSSNDDAVAMIDSVRRSMASMEPPGDFTAYVARLRAAHRPKRNFMALLDRAGW
jgi:hypothetical protein